AVTFGTGILVYFLLYEYPQNHPSITEAELKYITDGQESDMSENRPAVPWKKIFTSVPCYAYYYGLFGHYWSISYFLSVHPTFMGTILHFSMTENGATSCLPVAMKSVGGVIASFVSNWLTKKNYVGVNKLRKGCTSI
ncbi:inorganic phosphate cotransporter, partial [Trichonephila clavata]